MPCLDRLTALLDEQGIWYETHEHPRAFTAQGVADSEHLSGAEVAKVVVVAADEQLVMVVLPASSQVDLPALARVLNTREVRLAHEREFVQAFPDCEPGAMPPFGTLYGLPLYADPALASNATLVFQAGTHTDTMRIKFQDWVRVAAPHMVALARPAQLHRRALAR